MKTVFIAGASSDIGLAVCAQYLAHGGYDVIAHYRTMRPELDEILGSSRVTPFPFDFADTAGLEAELENRREFFEKADVLVNLAADLPSVSFEQAKPSDVLEALRVNYLPGMLLMQTMGPAMAARGWGRIVHASSIGVKFGGGENSFTYSLSKHALEFIPSTCRKWAAKNVLVNVVRVGVTQSRIHQKLPEKSLTKRAELIPMGRMATPQEMSDAIFWLGSEVNGYTAGQTISVSGGE